MKKLADEDTAYYNSVYEKCRREWIGLKNTLKVINYVLLGLALVAVGIRRCLPAPVSRRADRPEYESSAADLRAQAQLVDESTDKLSEDMKAQQDALREDISQGGDEGKNARFRACRGALR